MTFIGRFAAEKGADLLPQIIEQSILNGQHYNFIILGTGDKGVEYQIRMLANRYPSRIIAHIMYNEALSRRIYSGSDFLIMPSRVEPCGLNQMYALRYGTIPIVHDIGGLRDSVTEFDGKTGCGFKFRNLELGEVLYATHKAKEAYYSQANLKTLRSNAIKMDYSWEKSAQAYLEVYNQVITEK
jgi:starch synthase